MILHLKILKLLILFFRQVCALHVQIDDTIGLQFRRLLR